MGEDNLKEIVTQLKRIADCLEVMTAVPKFEPDPEQVKELEEILKREPITVVESTKLLHQDIIDAWNKELVPLGIPKIMNICGKRATLVSARIKQYGKEAFFKCIDEVKQSSFLQGRTSRPWTNFNFDWLICPNNFPKVLEGNYNDNRGHVPVCGGSLPESWLGN